MTTRPTALLRRIEVDNDLPGSERIRSRLKRANQRYHANDNISAYVMDGEVDELRVEVEAKMAEVPNSLVIDTGSHYSTQGTARRVAKMFLTEVFKGRWASGLMASDKKALEELNQALAAVRD